MLERLGITPRIFISLIGACLVKFGTAIITTWGNINLYILSYFFHKGQKITETTNPTILLMAVIPMIFATLAATKLCHRFGYEKVIKACGVLFFISPCVSIVFFKFEVFILFTVIFPASIFAIIVIPILNCMWALLPHSRNLITAILVVAYVLGSLVWNILFMHLVNPHNKQTEITRGDMNFFAQDVTDNVYKSIIITFCLAVGFTLVGALMIKRNQSQQQNEQQLNQQFKDVRRQDKKSSDKDMQIDEVKSQDEMLQSLKKPQVKNAMADKRFIIIILISFFISLYEIHLIMNIKIIFMPIVKDDHFLGYVSVLCNVVSIGGAIFWGWLGDKKGIAYSLFFLAVFDFGVKIYCNFAITKPTIVVMMILIGVLSKAVSTLAGPGFVEYFGLEIGTELIPYKAVAILAGFILVPLFQVITAALMSPHQYLMVLSFFSIVTLILAIRLYRIKTVMKEENKKQIQ